MVKIRLNRMGRRNLPFYRIVVTDVRRARAGKYIEAVGCYNPLKSELKINTERVNYWLSCGAQTTNTVKRLLKRYQKKEEVNYVTP